MPTTEHSDEVMGEAARHDEPMGLSRLTFGLVTLAGCFLAAAVFGFFLFANAVMRLPSDFETKADGILVLTGGDYRIHEGGRLLREGRAGRMLISGINAATSRDDIAKLSGLDEAALSCCVDLGYAAKDTVGNAEEARAWAEARQLRRLIVVTASYHMPRSLAELQLAMPGYDLIPHPVVTRLFRDPSWWLHASAARILLSEYVKYLPVAARLNLMRGFALLNNVAAAGGLMLRTG